MHFEWPWALAALLLLPLLAWRSRRLNPATLVFNRTATLPRSARQKFLRLPAALRVVAKAETGMAVSSVWNYGVNLILTWRRNSPA